MSINPDNFNSLFQTLAAIDLFGSAPPPPPFGSPVTEDAVRGPVESGAPALPLLYRTEYSDILLAQLGTVIPQLGDPAMIETLAGAVYQHGPGLDAGPLNRFLAVVSDLYRSFLSKKRRLAADFPVVETIPPLAMFQFDGSMGPFTIPCDDVKSLIGSNVGVVSQPAVYRGHPWLWGALAHETGGHDVTHADELLLPELQQKVLDGFGGGPVGPGGQLNDAQFQGVLWSYWMDEAAADVYGTLNMGPTFGHSLVAFFAALNARASGDSSKPTLRAASGFDPNDPAQTLDPHPTDVLRPYLIMGAVQSLSSLSQAVRDSYAQELDQLATICSPGIDEVLVTGVMRGPGGIRIPVRRTTPLTMMKAAAQQVGAMLVSTKLDSLAGHSIQEIETWDNTDESIATSVAASLAQGASIAGAGDDAQLLAGATLAAYANPGQYDAINRSLEQALDLSFQDDPIWGTPKPDPAFLRRVSYGPLRALPGVKKAAAGRQPKG